MKFEAYYRYVPDLTREISRAVLVARDRVVARARKKSPRGLEDYRVRDTRPDKNLSVLVPGGTSTFREFSKHRNKSQSNGQGIIFPSAPLALEIVEWRNGLSTWRYSIEVSILHSVVADINIDKRKSIYSLARWLSLRSFSSAAERRKIRHMNFRVETEQEEDGRWLAEVVDLPGVLAYGSTSKEAQAKVQALALRVVADRLEHGEAGPDLVSISFAAA